MQWFIIFIALLFVTIGVLGMSYPERAARFFQNVAAVQRTSSKPFSAKNMRIPFTGFIFLGAIVFFITLFGHPN